VGQRDQYYLGYRSVEQERLQRQAGELAEDSRWLFDQLGSLEGADAVEIGCGPQGCLDALAERVGATGRVIGVERSAEACELARALIAERNLTNVEIKCGDGRDTTLPRGAFDLVAARLVLVNVPQPEEILAEAVSLLKPGGLIAFHEAVWPVHTVDPPLPAWDRLYEILQAYAASNQTDLFVGRRLPRMLREQGVIDVKARPIIHSYDIDHGRRMLAHQFVENVADGVVAEGLASEQEYTELASELKHHLKDRDTFVISCLFIQAWGRIPAG
jgi:SAM-dependent methyltransferase